MLEIDCLPERQESELNLHLSYAGKVVLWFKSGSGVVQVLQNKYRKSKGNIKKPFSDLVLSEGAVASSFSSFVSYGILISQMVISLA